MMVLINVIYQTAPIANVTFLSKCLENIVANQLIAYLDANESIASVGFP